MLNLGERATIYEVGVILKLFHGVQGATENPRLLSGHPHLLLGARENPGVEKLLELRLEVVVLLGAGLIPSGFFQICLSSRNL
jgi:hypothetical protein